VVPARNAGSLERCNLRSEPSEHLARAAYIQSVTKSGYDTDYCRRQVIAKEFVTTH
jgi:hypothetical protein